MKYISAQEAAEKWDTSVRVVQRFCQNGRIAGAKKHGRNWLIPAIAGKPEDQRKERRLELPKYIMLTAPLLPKGDPEHALDLQEEKYRALTAADNAYRRGNPEPAIAYWYNTSNTDETKLSAAALAAAAAISAGDYALYYEIDHFLQGCMARAEDERTKALISLPGTMIAVSMAVPNITPKWLKKCDFSLFPQEHMPFLMYLYTLHLRNIGDVSSMMSTSKAAIVLCERETTFTWMDVYFRMICAAANYVLGNMTEAMHYLYETAELGLPYGFLEPFAEYLGAFGGEMEKFLASEYPQFREEVIAKWDVSYKNWIHFHNEFTQENITTILNSQEYHVASFLARDYSYAQIAERMELSTGRIKNIGTAVFAKLGIKRRSELKRFIAV